MGRAKTGHAARKKRRLKGNVVDSGIVEPNAKLSLPVISNEEIYCDDDDNLMKTLLNDAVGKQADGLEQPKVKISCEALNYERIIDFESNNVTSVENQKLKREPKRKLGRSRKCKTQSCKSPNVIKGAVQKTLEKSAPKTKNKPVQRNVMKPVEKKSLTDPYKKPTTIRISVKNPKLSHKSNSLKEKNENSDTNNKESLQICGKKPAVCYVDCTAQQRKKKRKDSLSSTFEDTNEHSSSNLNIDPLNTEDISSVLQLQDDESNFIELNALNLEEFMSATGELKMNMGDSASEKNKYVEEVPVSGKLITCDNSRDMHPSDFENVSETVSPSGKTLLQTVVERFMKNFQVNYLKGSNALKRGLCFSWLSNNYVCSNQQCLYNHNALNLFTNKLKRYSSTFIMAVVLSMKQDQLFVDVAMAAFKVISQRQLPVVWVTFLTFFVFYVTEPTDSRFLKFWATTARFFCDSQKNCSATAGFASLLAIFTFIEDSEKWKIIEFIKLIKQPPVHICVNFTLLQPVLKMELPLEFLTAAIESCMTTQKNVLKVYCFIIPKIPIMSSPIEVVELLLGFCKTLEELKHKDLADDLKQRLRGKVWSVHSKINHQKYPLTAAFQEELSVHSNEENCFVTSVSPQENSDMELPVLGDGNDYFHPEEDFCQLIAEALGFSTDAIPKRFGHMDDVGKRQVIRIKQFFRDYQFDLLGKYLNELKPNMTEQAAEEFLKLLFQMKISVQQGVDLLKIILLACKSHSAGKVVASISITLILNLVRINEWEKAYTIVSLCEEKQINLVEGKVYYTSEFNAITQCRIVLLIIEIYAYKENYRTALELVKKYHLFSSNASLWQLTWKDHDESIRVQILEDLLQQIIWHQLTKEAYDLFVMIWKEQKQLTEPLDLRKFVNDILILLLNQDNEEALNLFEQIKADDVLNDTTVRAVVITLVRRNRLSDAKAVVLSPGQNSYFIPKITDNSATVKIFSFWLEEEIYATFDAFFDSLINDKTSFEPEEYKNIEIQLEESKPNLTSRTLRPLCLGIITPSLKDACNRIQRVLQQQFSPPLKLIIMPYYLKLDEFSVKLHLQKRMKNLKV